MLQFPFAASFAFRFFSVPMRSTIWEGFNCLPMILRSASSRKNFGVLYTSQASADAWDVYSTPKFFLLDAERKIIGKQLNPSQMVDLIGTLKKRKAKEAAKGN